MIKGGGVCGGVGRGRQSEVEFDLVVAVCWGYEERREWVWCGSGGWGGGLVWCDFHYSVLGMWRKDGGVANSCGVKGEEGREVHTSVMW